MEIKCVECKEKQYIYSDSMDLLCWNCQKVARINSIELRDTRAELKRVKAERDQLRAAVEAVEWVHDMSYGDLCPWCDKHRKHDGGHAKDCRRQLALSPPGPLSPDVENRESDA